MRGRPEQLRIVLSARAVIATGEPFARHGEAFSDAGVALDEIRDLPRPRDAIVLRVDASGGTLRERSSVGGEWFCDAGGTPTKLPPPVWSYGDGSSRWAQARGWLIAWETCNDARWMLHGYGAALARFGRRPIVLAACACARTALPHVPWGDDRPRRAIEAAEAWARGKATLSAVRGAAYEPDHLYDVVVHHALVAAMRASSASYVATNHLAHTAADAAACAALAAMESEVAVREMADLVREHVPTLTVLRAAARR